MQSFEFKAAVLAGRKPWTLDSGLITKAGEPFCDLRQVDRALIAEMTVRYNHSAWFDLFDGKKRYRISCNLPDGDEHNLEFKRLVSAILADLAERKPDLPVAFGAGGGERTAMFTIGVLAFVFGAFVLIALMMGGVRDSKAMLALLCGGGFMLFGAWTGWSSRPWASPPSLPVSAASEIFARLAVKEEPSGAEDQGERPEQDKG
ncbi:hypothetical protein WNY37_07715 [Henriciella sp. AS95]|uniref:hypothetical protein n=1 Tax=Henriciella sp. AS95 TaxID=3135782 RepID=UPI00317CB3D7